MLTGLIQGSGTTNEALKTRLIECVQQEQAHFIKIAEDFHQALNHRTKDDYCVLLQTMIETTDRILNAANWEDSLFLRNLLKSLKKIKEQAVVLQQDAQATMTQAQPTTLSPIAADETLVYLSLFQNEGSNLRRWAMQLRSIQHASLSRPIYGKESDVQQVIRRKILPTSEAYVVAVVKKTDIQEALHQAQRVDRCGQPLLTLKAEAIKPSHIREFIHDQKRYYWQKGKLIPQT